MSLQLKIDYPETLPDALQQTRKQFEEEAKMAMAVKLFEMKRISSGVAAQLAGVDRVSGSMVSKVCQLMFFKTTLDSEGTRVVTIALLGTGSYHTT